MRTIANHTVETLLILINANSTAHVRQGELISAAVFCGSPKFSSSCK